VSEKHRLRVFGESIWNYRRMKETAMRGFINCIIKKINVTLVKHHGMNTYGGVEI
jgi:hypothetical protein